MGPRQHVLMLAAVLLASAAAPALAAARADERPGIPPRHLLLVTVEALRPDRCSFLMHERPTTKVPSDEVERLQHRAFGLDDLAASGVVFARAHAPSPVTAVSLATLFTSRTPLEHGLLAADERLPGESITLAECLRAGGFRTAAFVSGEAASDPSLAQGFDAIGVFERDGPALRAAATWLGRDPGSGQRMFAWVHLSNLTPPWSPRTPEPPAVDLLAGRVFVDPEYRGPADGSAAFFADVHAGRLRPSADDVRAVRAAYDREVAALTASLWAGLSLAFDFHGGTAEASETWMRTLFVLAGTSGFELLENGALGHAGTVSEAALRVPLILHHPDSLTGERILAEPVELADVLPTLLEWFELPLPPRVQGRSLLALTDSYRVRPFERRPGFAQLKERVFSVRTERWHLVWNPLGARPADRAAAAGPIPAVALYEPAIDPAERHDVAARHPQVVRELQDAIKAWREGQEAFPPERKPPPRR